MLLALPFAALLSVAAWAAPSAPQKSFDAVEREAESARMAGRLNEAIGLYREGVRLHPSWNQGWWWLGNLFYEQDRFPEAQASFTHFTAITPKPGAAWAFLGLCDYEVRDYTHSMEHFQRWMDGRGQGSSDLLDVASFHWALLLTRQGRFGRALYLLAGRATRKGESPLLVEAMGLASMRMTNLPEDYPPERREQVWLAGKAAFYASQHHFDRAREYFRRLLAEYGNLPNVHYFQGTLYKLHSRPDEAEREFRRELEVSPRHAAAMLELAQIDLDRDNSANAESLARQAVQLEPMNPDTHYILGRALLDAGRARESAQELERAERLGPEDAAIHFHLAAVYRGLGRKQDAERENSAYMSLRKRDGTLDQASGESEAHHSGEEHQ
jgi:tetratricopeptide (TPR) repeat protein